MESLAEQFWDQLIQLFVPTMVHQSKWKREQEDLKIGDVVLVLDGVHVAFKGKYRLARVVEVYPGQDGKVRKVGIAFKNYLVGEKVHEYAGAPDTIVKRPVQRLVLLTSE